MKLFKNKETNEILKLKNTILKKEKQILMLKNKLIKKEQLIYEANKPN